MKVKSLIKKLEKFDPNFKVEFTTNDQYEYWFHNIKLGEYAKIVEIDLVNYHES